MSRLTMRLVVAFLLLGSAAGLATRHVVAEQRTELAARRAHLTQLEAELRLHREQLALAHAELARLDRATAQAAAVAAVRESSPEHLWASRVLLMRQLLEEMPAQKIPELQLLTLLDWIQVARTAELDTANRIRTAFVTLRSAARRRFSEILRPALRAFVAASGGTLPADVRQLAPHLPPGTDVTILSRYEMVRTGKAGATDEYVIREKPGSDATLHVALESYSIDSHSPVDEPLPQNFSEAAERLSGVLEGMSDEKNMKAMGEKIMPFLEMLPVIVEKYTPRITEAFGAEPGELFKAAAFRFRAAHPDTEIKHLGQLVPYLPDQQKFLGFARHALAELEYVIAHKTPAPDEAALAPFLNKPFDVDTVLRAVEFKLENGQLSMNFKWRNTDSRTGVSTRSDSPGSP